MKKIFSILTIIITIVVIFIIFEVANVNSLNQSADDGVTYTQEEVDELLEAAKEQGRISVLAQLREALEAGRTVISVLKEFYPNQLVVASNGMYHWIDIDDSLKKHEYLIDNLVVDENTGEYTYVVDGEVKSQKGIDVSSHQGKIDWQKVKADGVTFAFVRGLYRGYGSGKIVVDDNCLTNIDGAKASGIEVGVYVFSQAISVEEAEEEATEVIKLLDGRSLDLPIVYDVEKVTNNEARMNLLSVEQRTEVALAFLNKVESLGYKTMIYHNTEMGAMLIDMSKFESYDKWFAGYNKEFYWPYDFEYWQYSEKGSVDGIKEAVDLDIRFLK